VGGGGRNGESCKCEAGRLSDWPPVPQGTWASQRLRSRLRIRPGRWQIHALQQFVETRVVSQGFEVSAHPSPRNKHVSRPVIQPVKSLVLVAEERVHFRAL